MSKLGLVLCMICISLTIQAEALFNEQGYRIENYRRATPDTAPAGAILNTDQLKQLIDTTSPVLVDVQAITVRPESREFGIAWLPNKERWHIAGSTWLPNVGYGVLNLQMQTYFRSNLHRLTRGDKQQAIVFYCVVDCWMSWNAVRRASALGYKNLYWYPLGTDGWEQAGLGLVEGTPYPLDPDQQGDDGFFTQYERLDLKQIAQQAKSSKRDILLFFETEHCPFCARMRKVVLDEVEVIKVLQADFIAFTVNIESDELMIDELGEAVKISHFSSKKHHIMRTPTMMFFDPEFNLLHKHSGLIATGNNMKKLLEFVNTGKYDTHSWREYKRL